MLGNKGFVRVLENLALILTEVVKDSTESSNENLVSDWLFELPIIARTILFSNNNDWLTNMANNNVPFCLIIMMIG